MNSTLPVCVSRIRNTNGWSARKLNRCTIGAAARVTPTAVAAAASLPSSSVLTKDLWTTKSILRGSAVVMPLKSAPSLKARFMPNSCSGSSKLYWVLNSKRGKATSPSLSWEALNILASATGFNIGSTAFSSWFFSFGSNSTIDSRLPLYGSSRTCTPSTSA